MSFQRGSDSFVTGRPERVVVVDQKQAMDESSRPDRHEYRQDPSKPVSVFPEEDLRLKLSRRIPNLNPNERSYPGVQCFQTFS
jgi:hypothetical protein